MTERSHGEWGDGQVQRWCAGCETWVLSIDWLAHDDHDPAGPTERWSTSDSSDRAGERPPNP